MVKPKPLSDDFTDERVLKLQRTCVEKLSLHSMRVELRRRHLDTSGLRSDLQARLLQDLAAQFFAAAKVTSTRRESGIVATRRRRIQFSTSVSVPDRFPGQFSLFSKLREQDDRQWSPEPVHIEEKSLEKDVKAFPTHPHVQVTGVIRGRAVWITGQAEMAAFWESAGPCGKANLSRSAPSFNMLEAAPVSSLKGRAMRQLLAMEEGEGRKQTSAERVNCEHLQLTLVEAFYSAFVSKHLMICDGSGKRLTNASEVWTLFCATTEQFALRLVAYCRYRSTGWLPRSGIKYGVDWVLYPAGNKKHSHAPYCVILRLDGEDGGARGMDRTWIRLQNRLRLVKNVAKTLIITTVYWADESKAMCTYDEAFRNAKVTEMTVDRWLP